MTSKEYNKMEANIRRSITKKYGFRQRAFQNFKAEKGYFFCLNFYSDSTYLSVKPLYADDLFWEMWDIKKEEVKSLSAHAHVYPKVFAEKLAKYDIPKTNDPEELTKRYEQIFRNANEDIARFLTENPDVDTFTPDESKVGDRDRLLYLMSLIHKGQIKEAMETIFEARKNNHHCTFCGSTLTIRDNNGKLELLDSGPTYDSYDHILHWCHYKANV